MSKSVQMDLAAKRMLRSTESTKDRASDRLREKKVKFRGIFRDKIAENRPISRNFAGIFRTNLVGKQSVEKTADFVVFRENVARNRSVLR